MLFWSSFLSSSLAFLHACCIFRHAPACLNPSNLILKEKRNERFCLFGSGSFAGCLLHMDKKDKRKREMGFVSLLFYKKKTYRSRSSVCTPYSHSRRLYQDAFSSLSRHRFFIFFFVFLSRFLSLSLVDGNGHSFLLVKEVGPQKGLSETDWESVPVKGKRRIFWNSTRYRMSSIDTRQTRCRRCPSRQPPVCLSIDESALFFFFPSRFLVKTERLPFSLF